MPTTTIAGTDVTVDDEGFLTEYDEWNETVGEALAPERNKRVFGKLVGEVINAAEACGVTVEKFEGVVDRGQPVGHKPAADDQAACLDR